MPRRSKNKPTKERKEFLKTLLTDDLRQKVEEGEWDVYEGQNAEKPVVIDENGRLVKGSGRWPNANDPVATGKRTGYKKSDDYRDAIRTIISLDGDESRYGSFAWLVDQGLQAASGSPQRIKCPNCDYNGIFAFKKDSNAIIKLIELVHGRARETQDIHVKSEQLLAILQERFDPSTLEVHAIDPEESERRRILLTEGND